MTSAFLIRLQIFLIIIKNVALLNEFFYRTENPIAYTSKGFLSGNIQKLRTGQLANSFLGIPYAEPPIGDLRWSKPVPRKPWWNTFYRNATKYSPACPQIEKIPQSEDCLYLNVIAPSRNSKEMELRPVLVIIHGGSFDKFSSRNYPGQAVAESLVQRGVIVVTINYRLGPLEIINFGGDPKRVTLYGESAGSMSVSFLTLMKDANGLFHQVIQQSNSIFLDEVKLRHDQYAVKVSLSLMREALCENYQRTTDKLACLRKLPLSEILSLQETLHTNKQELAWVPFIDPKGFRRFVANRRKMNALYVVNKHEAAFWMLFPPFNQLKPEQFGSAQFHRVVETLLKAHRSKYTPKLRDIVTRIYQLDEIETESGLVWFNKTVEAFTDGAFAAPQWIDAKQMTDGMRHRVFLMSFDHVPENYHPFPGSTWSGALHTLDIEYLNGAPGLGLFQYKPTVEDQRVANMYSEIVFNFAAYGDPQPVSVGSVWFPIIGRPWTNSTSSEYFSLSSTPSVNDEFYPNARRFWAETVIKM